MKTDRSFRRIIKPGQQGKEGRFPRAGAADNGHRFPRGNQEAQLMQHFIPPRVAKSHLPKFDGPRPRRQFFRPSRIRHFVRGVQNLKHPLCRPRRSFHRPSGVTELLQRGIKHSEIRQKHQQVSQGHLPRRHLSCPGPKQCRRTRRQQSSHHQGAGHIRHGKTQIRLQ